MGTTEQRLVAKPSPESISKNISKLDQACSEMLKNGGFSSATDYFDLLAFKNQNIKGNNNLKIVNDPSVEIAVLSEKIDKDALHFLGLKFFQDVKGDVGFGQQRIIFTEPRIEIEENLAVFAKALTSYKQEFAQSENIQKYFYKMLG